MRKLYDSLAETPEYVPIQNRQKWLDLWHQTYDERLAAGEEESTAQVYAFAEADSAFGPNAATDPVQEAAMPEVLKLDKQFAFFRLVDKADGKHSVSGIATSESVDHDGEMADYEGTLESIKVWSADFAKTTGSSGQDLSLGNIRVQHDPKIIGGKVTAVNPDNKSKAIAIETEPRDAIFDEYIQPGLVTGFSIAGSYKSRKCNDCGAAMDRGKFCADCKKNVIVRYVPEIAEISYVDKPCNDDAVLQHVKTDGSMELVKFAEMSKGKASCKCDCKECKTKGCKECSHAGCDCAGCDCPQQKADDSAGVRKVVEDVLISAGLMKEKKTKRVGGKDLHASDFAYVGDPDDTSTWKLPIHDASHCRNALARFNQTQGIPANEKAKVKAKIVARAKRFGIKVTEDSKKCVRFAFAKVLAKYFTQNGIAAAEAVTKAEETVARIEEVIEKVDGETKLFKGLYTVSQLAEILQGLQWIVASTEYEREFEGDDSDVPDDLRSALEDLVPIFVAMATEEANELLQQTHKTANGGQGGKSMSEQNTDLLKAAKEAFGEFWKKAKSLYHKCAKCHKALAEAHEDRAEHHKALHEHHSAMSEAAADADTDKSVKTELEKLTAGSDFAKMDELGKAEAKLAILEKSKHPHVAGHAKIAKAHLALHKCSMKAAGHHSDLHKAHSDLGDAEQAPDAQGRTKDDSAAHAGGSSEKVESAELLKSFKSMLEDALKPIKDEVAAVKGDVDKHLSKLQPGPGDQAGKPPVLDDKNKPNAGDGNDGSYRARKSASSAPREGVGVFAK